MDYCFVCDKPTLHNGAFIRWDNNSLEDVCYCTVCNSVHRSVLDNGVPHFIHQERRVRKLTYSLDRLVSAPLSERAYEAEVEKLVAPLAKRNRSLLSEVLARAEDVYDSRRGLRKFDPHAISACRETVKKLRKQWS